MTSVAGDLAGLSLEATPVEEEGRKVALTADSLASLFAQGPAFLSTTAPSQAVVSGVMGNFPPAAGNNGQGFFQTEIPTSYQRQQQYPLVPQAHQMYFQQPVSVVHQNVDFSVSNAPQQGVFPQSYAPMFQQQQPQQMPIVNGNSGFFATQPVQGVQIPPQYPAQFPMMSAQGYSMPPLQTTDYQMHPPGAFQMMPRQHGAVAGNFDFHQPPPAVSICLVSVVRN